MSSRPTAIPPLHPSPPFRSSVESKMATETQKPPAFSPLPFPDYPNSRRLPPLNIQAAVPPSRNDFPFQSPVNHLPSIHPNPLRHDPHHPTPFSRQQAPVDKLLHSSSYTPPRSDPPYSPQQYGPAISPRTEYDGRGPRRMPEQRYPYEDTRAAHHPPPHREQSYALASPIEPSQQRAYAPLPSPGYTPSYVSSSTTFRGSMSSHSQSAPSSLGPLAYPEPSSTGPPPRQEPRSAPLPGSIPQPVFNDQL